LVAHISNDWRVKDGIKALDCGTAIDTYDLESEWA
jgi:hypothetical protein